MPHRRPNVCICTPIPKQDFVGAGERYARLSITYNPGCPRCATCICHSVLLELKTENPWATYRSENSGCVFCNPESQPSQLPRYEVLSDCFVCGAAGGRCDCTARVLEGYGAEGEGEDEGKFKERKRDRMKRVGEAMVNAIKKLKKDRKDPDGGSENLFQDVVNSARGQ